MDHVLWTMYARTSLGSNSTWVSRVGTIANPIANSNTNPVTICMNTYVIYFIRVGGHSCGLPDVF